MYTLNFFWSEINGNARVGNQDMERTKALNFFWSEINGNDKVED